MTRRGGRRPALAVAAVVVAVGLTACSSASDPSPGRTDTPSVSPTTAYPSGAPSGTVLTDPGSELSLGESATVSWQPRQNTTGTVRISVDRIERTTFAKSFQDWKIDPQTKAYAPYFVHAQVTNVGAVDLSGVPVPIYGESAANELVEAAVFKETFKPCHPSALPKPFATGTSTSVCLVYLVPNKGSLVGAAFRPTQQFDPIIWKGPVATIGAGPSS